MTSLHTAKLGINLGGRRILDGLDFTLETGQVMAIIGPNGSGKSTLLKALSRNLRPDSGAVYLDQQDIHSLSTRLVAQKMAVLPQSPQAPRDLTVRDLVEYGRYPHQKWWQGRSPEDDSCVDWALELTGLTAMAARIVSTLSGGERQRVWIAMALAQKPEILLLDEPTTYLDICHQLEIMELIGECNRRYQLTVAMVLHDINQAARYADCVAVVQDGTLFAVGHPAQVITAHTLRQVFGVESEITIDNTGRPVILITGLTAKRG